MGFSPFGELGRVLVCRDLCELWRQASLSIGAPQTTLERGLFTGKSERLLNRGSGDHLSLWVLCENLEGLPYGGP
jgi:hypothetical protein